MMMGLPLDYSYQTWTGDNILGHTHELSYSATVSGVDVGLTLGRNVDTTHSYRKAITIQHTLTLAWGIVSKYF